MAPQPNQLHLWEDKSVPPKPQKLMRDYIIEAGPFNGTYGSVYIGLHRKLNYRVAIKQLHPHVLKKVIRQEADKLMMVKSPYVVQIKEFWVKENVIVMEYCPIGLDCYLKKEFNKRGGKLRYIQARELLQYILQGLIDAHSFGIIHGDIKPANVRFGVGDTDEEIGYPKLGDFGADRSQKETGQSIPGSHNWMAPELLKGGTATESSDFFSFGILAYLILSGRHPFFANDPSCLTSEEDKINDIDFNIIDLATLEPDIPPRIATLIMGLLSKDHNQREVLAEQLKVALSEPLEPTEPPVATPFPSTGLSKQEDEQLAKAYNLALDFFHNYHLSQAIDTLENVLINIKWERFIDQKISYLADCWSLKAFINNSLREFDIAIDSSSNGLLINHEHINSLHTRAYAYTQLGNYDQAKLDLTKALVLCSDPYKERQLKQLLSTIEQRLKNPKRPLKT